MELMNLYNQINNPIDDKEIIKKLIRIYSNISRGYSSFYWKLIECTNKNYRQRQFNKADFEEFSIMMFNKWKNSVVKIENDEFRKLMEQGIYQEDFLKMQNYLRNIPAPKTLQEVNNILFNDKNNRELQIALEKYRWDAFGEGSGWTFVNSQTVTLKMGEPSNREHRLYLNPDASDIYKLITHFILKCDKYQLPYYLKFNQYANRADAVVIYSSYENLLQYIKILEEINQDYPELISRIKEPPILTGKITNWLGYGSEPSKNETGQIHSFNEIRANVLQIAIDSATKKWLINNLKKPFTYQNQKISLQDYLVIQATENLIASLEHSYNLWADNIEETANQAGKVADKSQIITKVGYSLQDIQSQAFKANLYESLKEYIPKNLVIICNNVLNKTLESNETLIIKVSGQYQITFNYYDLEKILQKFSVEIIEIDSNFISFVQEEIRKCSKKYGIDSNKFCFDNYSFRR